MSKKKKRRTRKEIDRSLNLSKDGGRSMSKGTMDEGKTMRAGDQNKRTYKNNP